MSNKILLFALVIFSFQHFASAQYSEVPERSKHRVYAEVGSYLFVNTFMINYEPTIYESKSRNFRLNGRMGLGLGLVLGFDGSHGISGGLGGFTFDFGKKNSHFLLSSGIIVGSSFNEIDDITVNLDRIGSTPLLEIGWRYEKPQGGWMYKIAGGTLGLSFGVGYSF